MKKFILVISLMVLSACSKDVNRVANPISGDGGTVAEDDNQDYTFHTAAIFANHSPQNSSSDNYSSFSVSEHIEILVPTKLYATSFSDTRPTLVLMKNTTQICQYVWVLNKYQSSSNCPSSLVLQVNDQLSMRNIPKSHTANLNLYYKRL